MIFLLHGGGALGLHNRLKLLKKGFEGNSIFEYSGKETSFKNAKIEVNNLQLFSEKRIVILEDFSDVEFENLKIDEDLTLIFKYSKKLPANSVVLKSATKNKINIEVFDEERETPIFPFLDKLGDKNSQALAELNKNLDEWGGQYVITMMCYLLRRLIVPAKNAPAFVVQRIERQKKNFSVEEIKELYRNILEGDFKIKSGLIEERMALTLMVERFLR